MESKEEKMNKAKRLRPEHKMENCGKKGGDEIEEESGDQEESRLFSKSLSQFELVAEDEQNTCTAKCSCGAKCRADLERGVEGIARELRALKRQNLISHCLLTVMIVVTGAWQISEVSLLLSVKEKLCNPLKAVGNLLRNSIKGRWKNFQIEGPPLPPIEVPQVPVVNLLPLPLNDKEN